MTAKGVGPGVTDDIDALGNKGVELVVTGGVGSAVIASVVVEGFIVPVIEGVVSLLMVDAVGFLL